MKQRIIILCIAGIFGIAPAQITSFPYHEHFDTVAVPQLPSGWSTSTNKNLSGDFLSSLSSPRSQPNCISTSNSRISQFLVSPIFSFVGKIGDSLEFFERRSGTFTGGMLIEASIDNDTSFSIPVSDTLTLTSSNNGAYQRRTFALPETLNGQSTVRFRWRVVGSPGSGTTAALRIDDVTVTVKKALDLSLRISSYAPSSPKQGETLTGTFSIVNRALPGSFSGTVQVFDSLQLIASDEFSKTVAAKDSFLIEWIYPNISAGRHPIRAVLLAVGDEDTENNSIEFSIIAGYRQRTLLINEIMYAPLAGSPEWIELVNIGNDTIPAAGWKVSDAGSTKGALSSAKQLIPPHSYIIVTTDTNAFKSINETTTLLFQAPFSALNNSGDAVVLFDFTNSMIDSLSYFVSWGGGTGKSLERIDTAKASTPESNWTTSKHPSGATPGAVNSVTQKQFDAAISHISISPLLPVAEMPVIVSATVENIGRLSIPVTEILLYRDVNSDSIFIDAELLARQSLPSLAAGESLVVNFSLAPFPQGTYRIGASIAFSQDDDPDNNIALFDLSIGLPPRSIVINEVMYAPSGDIPEWIEGYNISVSPVDIHGWRISDNGTAKGIVQSHSPVVPSGTFFIITTDTVQLKNSFVVDAPLFQAQFSALNNTTVDAVVLFDERGIVMDSISYRPAWGGTNGSSLQRYDPSAPSTDSANWLSDFPSPGIENESVRKDFDITLHRIAAEKIPDGFLITIVALNSGRYRADSARVHLYGDTIPLIGNIIFSSNISPVDPLDSAVITFEWHTKLSGRKHLLATMDYPRDMRLQNNFGSISVVNSFPLQTMVINEIMYEPFVGNSEFVELMNRTSDTVDIAGWALVDQPGTSGNRTTIAFSQHSHPIAPGTFAVIASDSAIFTQFPDLTQQNIFIHTALSLSNSGEDLVLLDISGSTIDSLRYSPSWHIKNLSVSGRSIERIDPSGNSADERNWSSSVSRNGSSPMQKNSVFIGSKSPAAALGLSPNPFSPDQDGFEDFLSINYSLPSNSATIRIRIYDVTGRLIRRLAQQEPSPSTGSVVWNGCDDNGNPVRIGMYIVLFEALDNFGGMVLTAKDVAVVARKL